MHRLSDRERDFKNVSLAPEIALSICRGL